MNIISAAIINKIVSMSDAIGLMEKAFRSLSDGNSFVPLRSVVDSSDKKISLFFKPVFDDTLGRMAVKVLSQNEGNRERGIPTITGLVILFDGVNGRILSTMDGESITAMRTGAASGLATKLLSREESECFALFGCGAQGLTQIEAVLSVRKIKEIFLFDKSRAAADGLIRKIRPKTDAQMSYSTDLNVLRKADIITTATGSKQPLFERNHISPGVHINAIGGYKPDMQEIAGAIIREAIVIVDQREACLKESGDLVIPLRNGIIKPNHIAAEIGELIAGKHKGRISDNDITVFKSVGNAVQDLYVANAVYEKIIQNRKPLKLP